MGVHFIDSRNVYAIFLDCVGQAWTEGRMVIHCPKVILIVCRTKFGRIHGPAVPEIRKFIAKICETGFIHSLRTPENIEVVTESIRENPSTSTRHHSPELNISPTCLCRILRKDLDMTPCSVQLV